MAPAVLSVRDLVVEIPTRRGVLRPVDHVSLDIAPGEILGVVGESGAGKSMTGNAVVGLLNRPARITSGEIWLGDTRLDTLSREDMRKRRGREVGMVFQDPLTSLNPLLTIGEQLTETIEEHLNVTATQARDRALAGLEEVGIPAAAQRMDSYPHEFSGGMRQRVMIAIALACDPKVLIADEPTTALDVTIQAQILDLLAELQAEFGMAIIFISHDLAVISQIS
ncbi:MAG: ABC transporter ATP-binding protein, partial [Pseudomonadota bacterium]